MSSDEDLKFNKRKVDFLPADWHNATLREISKDISYGYTASAVYANVGPRFVRITDIVDGKINWDSVPFCKIGNIEKYKLSKGDIIVARTGASTGANAIMDVREDAVFASYLIRFRIDESLVDPFFVGYILKSHSWNRYISSVISGSAQPGINAKQLSEFTLSFPKIEEQKAITKILTDLDEKIELNQQMNKTLEAIAQAIFKRRFIDFEFPNENGRPYKSSGGEMVDSELGEIPKGWRISKIDAEYDLVMGQSPPGKSYNDNGEGAVFFQGRTDFGDRFPSVRLFCTMPKKYATKGDTLVSVRAPVGDINMAFQDCSIGRGLAAILHKLKFQSYTYYFMKTMKQNFDTFEAKGTVFGSITKTDFENIKIIAPTREVLHAFETLVNPMDEKIEYNSHEIQSLSRIRSLLLPKLMTGKIRVPLES